MADALNTPRTGSSDLDITFFVPCLNEAENVCGSLDTIVAAVAETARPVAYEILVVDDCSTDDTVAVVESYSRAHPEVPIRIETSDVNQGLGRNYARGARIAHGRYYMLVNGDNVEQKETLVGLLALLGTADILIPHFGAKDHRPLGRRVVSRTFTFLVNTLSGNRIGYYNGPVVHLRENVVRWHPGTKGFAYEAELITRLLAQGATYAQLEVHSAEREHGVSKAFRFENFISVGGSLMRIALRRIKNLVR